MSLPPLWRCSQCAQTKALSVLSAHCTLHPCEHWTTRFELFPYFSIVLLLDWALPDYTWTILIRESLVPAVCPVLCALMAFNACLLNEWNHYNVWLREGVKQKCAEWMKEGQINRWPQSKAQSGSAPHEHLQGLGKR